ncbi:hypothetical protein B0H13DRAFT_2668868 [Mycena leptocephala]|nr:hypothetical protein B0H13DRAFT_2668868 [Mycena leptocephala]
MPLRRFKRDGDTPYAIITVILIWMIFGMVILEQGTLTIQGCLRVLSGITADTPISGFYGPGAWWAWLVTHGMSHGHMIATLWKTGDIPEELDYDASTAWQLQRHLKVNVVVAAIDLILKSRRFVVARRAEHAGDIQSRLQLHFTLGLCVWTAIHLNIPERASAGRQFLRKLVWLAVGLLAPEVVTFTAWNQYADAARLVRELAKTARPRPSLWSGLRRRVMSLGVAGGKSQYDKVDVTEMNPSLSPSRHVGDDWNLVHGFYAVMGGYVVDLNNSGDPFLPNGITRLTLTPDGVQFLLKHAPTLIPRVSEEDINDKSKADGLAKLLVALQAAWFCLQCIARGAQHLPISLLEITTGGHALYTLFTYVLWAYKPMNISIPTPGEREGGRRGPWGEALASVDEFQLISTEPVLPPPPDFYSTRPPPETKQAPEGGVLLRLGDALEDTGFWMKRQFPWRHYNNRYYTLALDPLTIRRWRLAWGAMKYHLPTSREYVVSSASNVPVFKSANQATAQLMLAFMAAEIVYAGIHAAGWNADFASARLQLAWRAACCVIGGGGVFVAVFGFSWAFADSGKPYWD